jgi:hypothetical protein
LLSVSSPKYVLSGHLKVDMPCDPAASILSFKQGINGWVYFILDNLTWYNQCKRKIYKEVF